jgi:hypothetical protein
MQNTPKTDTPTHGHPNTDKAPHTPCCQNPRTHGYPEENPVVHICLKCGTWNWENY